MSRSEGLSQDPRWRACAGRFGHRLRLVLEMIRFEHSVFALPFALTGALLAWRESGFDTARLGWKLGWILAAMVGARSAAMAFNRLVDAELDARNPRTRGRHLPSGLLSRGFVWAFAAVSMLVFLLAARALNPLCFKLAPPVLALVLLYSYTKRFTTLSHLILGLALGLAPAGAWIAMRGSLDARVLWLTAAVTLWTAGFDIIYACQDYEFDRAEGLHSYPGRLGIGAALRLSRGFHAGMVACLLAVAASFRLGGLSLAGVAVIAALLIWEHHLVRPDDLSKVDAAFFTVNGYVSVLFFLFWAADVAVFRPGR